MYFLSTEPLASDRNEMQMSILLNMLASFMGVKSTNEDFLLCSHLKHTVGGKIKCNHRKIK
ncbi:hypothetical protein KTS02_001851 [Campylobacter coli]|nr:hypothetical protein [Campylobacter coli]